MGGALDMNWYGIQKNSNQLDRQTQEIIVITTVTDDWSTGCE